MPVKINPFTGNLDLTGSASGYLPLTGGTLTGDLIVPDEAYGAGWNASLEVPTKNAIYDKIETMGGGSGLTQGQVYAAANNLFL